MKLYLPVIALLLTFQTAHAALLERSDLSGRLMVADQQTGAISGTLELSANSHTMSMQVMIGKRPLNCEGDAEFDQASQYLVAKLDCGDGTNVSVTLNVKEIEIVSYLQGGLASAKMGVYLRKTTVGPAKSIYNGAVDIKKLN